MSTPCPHCPEEHAEGAKFCSSTGRPLGGDPASASTAPEKGIYKLLEEALELYRTHARAFLFTAAVLLVPGSLISSCALSAVMAPVMVDVPSAKSTAERLARRGEELSHRLGEALDRQKDTVDTEVVRRTDEDAHELRRDADRLAHMALGGVMAEVLRLAGWALIALILYAFVFPLTYGALTIAVADRVLGGSATWREHWMLLFRRLGLLLSALLPAAVPLIVGYFCMVVPGLVLSLLFAFAAPVVLIEGVGGTAALRRSFLLVRADWLRTALMLTTFGVLNALAHWLVALFLPRGAIFFGRFLGDLLMLLVMPVPIIASVLLYFDLRRRVDGISDDKLRSELEALR